MSQNRNSVAAALMVRMAAMAGRVFDGRADERSAVVIGHASLQCFAIAQSISVVINRGR